MAGEVFETSGGPLTLRPVSLEAIARIRAKAERELRAQGLPLDPPTYQVTTAAGTIEEHPHTAETLETEEDRQRWAEYEAAIEALDTLAGQRITRYMLAEGIVLDGPDQAWLERMERLGVPLSDDPLEQREQYLTYQYARTQQELLALIQRIMVLSAEGNAALLEAAEAMETFFRGDVAGPQSAEAAT